MYSYGSPHTAAQKQDDQHERTFSSYVRIQVVVLKTCLGRWTIGRSGEKGSGISVLPARYDDDDDDLLPNSTTLKLCDRIWIGSNPKISTPLYMCIHVYNSIFNSRVEFVWLSLLTKTLYSRESRMDIYAVYSVCHFVGSCQKSRNV